MVSEGVGDVVPAVVTEQIEDCVAQSSEYMQRVARMSLVGTSRAGGEFSLAVASCVGSTNNTRNVPFSFLGEMRLSSSANAPAGLRFAFVRF